MQKQISWVPLKKILTSPYFKCLSISNNCQGNEYRNRYFSTHLHPFSFSSDTKIKFKFYGLITHNFQLYFSEFGSLNL